MDNERCGGREPPYTVIRNDGDLQCIRFKDGTFMAAFHQPGAVTVDKSPLFAVDTPCIVIGSGDALALCDPMNSKQGTPAKITWNGKTSAIVLPSGGRVLTLSLANLKLKKTPGAPDGDDGWQSGTKSGPGREPPGRNVGVDDGDFLSVGITG